jgi:2-C-methyl-D-erythritol 4-phosphate cytidylyltransferase / 2-C-methyl-D-erythritol 2,4-cyclodiphosphate synthase
MIGLGFDVHRLADGESLWLGGIEIPSERGTVAHSDGDVILHALVDALLGAIGAGDIGEHFPDSDPQWKGASSSVFVEHAVSLVRERECTIINVDVTVVLQAPKILDHKAAMRSRIAVLCGLDEGRVNVKATTSEHLGYAGRKEGVHAWVVCEVQPERP